MTTGVLAGSSHGRRARAAHRRLRTTRSTRPLAFKIAGSLALKEAARRAQPTLLEPVFAVEVVTPTEFMGDVMGDLTSRRGHIDGMEQRGNAQVINATVPLSTMFGYATDLRSSDAGRATYTMQFKRTPQCRLPSRPR